MCRSVAEGYRRCPGHGDAHRRKLTNVRRRISRYEKAAQAASSAEQWDRAEHYVSLLERDCAEHTELTRAEVPPSLPSRAAEFTREAAAHLTEGDLVQAVSECAGDPAALDAIMHRLDERQTEQQRAAERDRERADARARQSLDELLTPLTNPGQRAARNMTADQQCREAYDSYVLEQWMQAETDCRGHLLSPRGQAKGIDPAVLFEGPSHVARAYASDELSQWWARNGRVTYRQWRYQWFGRASDREAAATARRQDLGEAPA